MLVKHFWSWVGIQWKDKREETNNKKRILRTEQCNLKSKVRPGYKGPCPVYSNFPLNTWEIGQNNSNKKVNKNAYH